MDLVTDVETNRKELYKLQERRKNQILNIKYFGLMSKCYYRFSKEAIKCLKRRVVNGVFLVCSNITRKHDVKRI